MRARRARILVRLVEAVWERRGYACWVECQALWRAFGLSDAADWGGMDVASRQLIDIMHRPNDGRRRLKGVYDAIALVLGAHGLCLSPKYLANVAYYGRKLNEKGVGR